MLGVFLISLVSAQLISLGTFQQNTNITLIQICGTCTTNNISTVLYPNSTVAISNVEMTRDGSYYNFTLDSSFTQDLGTYIVNGVGDLGGTNTAWSYDFVITPTGRTLGTPDSILYIILTAASVFVFLLCLLGGLVLPFRNRRNDQGRIISVEKLKYFKVGLLFLSYVFFVWMLNLLFALSNNFSILTQHTGFFKIVFLVINSMSYVVFVFMLILMSILAWKDLALNKLLSRGINP